MRFRLDLDVAEPSRGDTLGELAELTGWAAARLAAGARSGLVFDARGAARGWFEIGEVEDEDERDRRWPHRPSLAVRPPAPRTVE